MPNRFLEDLDAAIASDQFHLAGKMVVGDCGDVLAPYVSTIALRVIRSVLRNWYERGVTGASERDKELSSEAIFLIRQLCNAIPPASWPAIPMNCEWFNDLSIYVLNCFKRLTGRKKTSNWDHSDVIREVAMNIQNTCGIASPLLPACLIIMFPRGEGSIFLAGHLSSYTSDDAESILKQPLRYSSILSMYLAIFPLSMKTVSPALQSGDQQFVIPFLSECLEVFLRPSKCKCTCRSQLICNDIIEKGGDLCFQCCDGVINVEPCIAREASSYVKMILPRLTQEGSEKITIKQLSAYRCDSVSFFFRVRVLGVGNASSWLSEKVGVCKTLVKGCMINVYVN